MQRKPYRKFPTYYIRQTIAQISQKMQRKTYKFPLYYIRQTIAHISQKTQRKTYKKYHM